MLFRGFQIKPPTKLEVQIKPTIALRLSNVVLCALRVLRNNRLLGHSPKQSQLFPLSITYTYYEPLAGLPTAAIGAHAKSHISPHHDTCCPIEPLRFIVHSQCGHSSPGTTQAVTQIWSPAKGRFPRPHARATRLFGHFLFPK